MVLILALVLILVFNGFCVLRSKRGDRGGWFLGFCLRVDVWKKGVYGFVCYSGSLGMG